MPETKSSDDLEKLLSDLKSIQDRKQALIDDLLRQKLDSEPEISTSILVKRALRARPDRSED